MRMLGVFTKSGKLIAASPSIKAVGAVFHALLGTVYEPWEIKLVDWPDPVRGAQIGGHYDQLAASGVKP